MIYSYFIIERFFGLLEKATAQDSPSVSDIPLVEATDILRILDEAFGQEQEILYTALSKVEIMAAGIILENFQKEEIPLFEYPKRLLLRRIKLQPTVDGGSLAYLPTTVDGIFVRYHYPRGQESPIMSLEVRRLE